LPIDNESSDRSVTNRKKIPGNKLVESTIMQLLTKNYDDMVLLSTRL